MWIKDLIEDILSPVYPGIDLQEVRSVGVNRLDNDGILPVYATSDSDRQALNELVEQEGRELNTEVQQLVFIRGDFGRFLQLFGTDPVLLDWDGNNFTIEFNVARWPDWFSIKIINEDITMPINTPIYYLDANGQAVPAGVNNPIPSGSSSATFNTVTMQNAVSASGNGTVLNVTGMAVAVLSVFGTFVGTVFFETVDENGTWIAINATQIGVDALLTSTTTTGLYRLSVAGLTQIRARVAWTSGTSVSVVGRTTAADSHAKIVTLAKKKLTTTTLSNVNASASSVTILAANTNREDAIIFNDSASNLRIKFGATASSTSFTILIGPSQYFTLSDQTAIYTGIIDGIWDSATGAARVTEVTA